MTNEENKAFDQSKWTEAFKHAAILYHDGRRLYNEDIECDAYAKAALLIEELDAMGPNGRDFLIPLIKDPDFEVKVIAAAFMAKHDLGLTLEALKDVDENGGFEARLTGMHVEFRIEHNELI